MKLIKHIFVLALVIAFTFNATAGFAAGMCGCDHSDSQIMEMPCHDAETAELEQVSPDDSKQEQKMAQCTMCKCGHCKTHSHASLNQVSSSADMIGTGMSLMPHSDVMISNIIFGIDNPPKHIS